MNILSYKAACIHCRMTFANFTSTYNKLCVTASVLLVSITYFEPAI